MKSVMTHQFSRVPQINIPRSTFVRSHGYKTTFDSGYLVPFFVDEALPGDTFSLNASLFARLSTPVVPVMDNVFLETFFFAVPYRLVWENWEEFNGEIKGPSDVNSTERVLPQISSGNGWPVGSLEDYFGLPVGVPNLSVHPLFHRAYNLIYNEWFRRQYLQDPVPVPTGDGIDDNSNGQLYKLLRRAKRHDYFTSALPWPQSPSAEVSVPVGDRAPVLGDRKALGLMQYSDNTYKQYGLVADTTGTGVTYALGDASGKSLNQTVNLTDTNRPVGGLLGVSSIIGRSGLYADLSNATGAAVNDLRNAIAVQRLLEKDARGGTRYIEIIKSHFGVTSPDARLQRPEFLGGHSEQIHFQPVPQNSNTANNSNTVNYDASGTVTGSSATVYKDTPQGNLAAYAVGSSQGNGFVKSFTEHTLIIGLVNVRADLTYQQGIPRMFSRKTRFDFYWPALANIGEQAVLNKEIFAQGTASDDDVFGYQERHAEYRYYPSKITGKFRSSFGNISDQSLDVWHLSQEFDSLPQLNEEFILENPPIKRLLAVQDEPEFLLDCYFDMKCTRPMPVYSVPGSLSGL